MSRPYQYLQQLNHTFKFTEQAPEYLRMFAGAGIAGFATYVITSATKSEEVRQSRKLYEEEQKKRSEDQQRYEQKIKTDIAQVQTVAEVKIKQAQADVKRLEQEKRVQMRKAKSWEAAYRASVCLWRVVPAHQTADVSSESQADSKNGVAAP